MSDRRTCRSLFELSRLSGYSRTKVILIFARSQYRCRVTPFRPMRQTNAKNVVTFRALLSYGFVMHRLVFVGVKRSSLMKVMFRKLHELATFFRCMDVLLFLM